MATLRNVSLAFGPWTTPTFQNSWTKYASGGLYGNVGYRKMPDGTVVMRGLIASGTQNNTAFTLPVGYRPTDNQLFACAMNGGVNRITVQTDGQVVVQETLAGTFNNTWISLNEVRFLGEQ